MRRTLALAVLLAVVATVPSAAAGQVKPASRVPATMAYSFPEQCVVLPVTNKPFATARALLARLGCRSRRVQRPSTVPKNLVISVVGGTRSYAFGHVVTLVVSSGPPAT